MTATTGDQLLTDYLGRLDAAALQLPPDRRAELMEGIAEHVAAARAAGELRDEAAVRTLLDRLGEPEEIVSAAADEVAGGRWGPPPRTSPGPQLVPTRPGTPLETAAVVMLTAGSLIPVAGWLVGVVLLWTSKRWRTGEKLLGTLVVPGGPGILLPLSVLGVGRTTCFSSAVIIPSPQLELSIPPLDEGAPAAPPPPPEVVTPPVFQTVESCSDPLLPGPAMVAVVVVALVAPFLVAAVLLRRARARAAADPPVLRPAVDSGWTSLEIAAVVVLGLGSFLAPVVGPAVGLVLAWVSPRWTSQEKLVATALGLTTLAVALLLFFVPFIAPGAGSVAFGPVLALVFGALGPLTAAAYLAVVLSGRQVR